ncbi:MAG: cation-translocating P-type ATPase, partial [Limisphaerales bacterium]
MDANEDKQWHELGAGELLGRIASDAQNGLGERAAAERLQKYGANALPEEERKSMWRVFARQFQSPLIYILFVAAVLAFALGKRGDAVVILLVVVINSVIGTFQEGRAERSMAALRKLSALKVRVVRDGHEKVIEAGELVPGDVLLLAAGDGVGADARVIEHAALEAAEAALTGESLPVVKNANPLPSETLLADRRNMVYSGTHVTAGRGRAVVVATGTATEVGKIARMTQTAEEPKTPLEMRIAQFGRYLVGAAVVIFVSVVGIGLGRGMPPTEIFMVAISQMVSMVPEGLPVAMTIALAVGMQRMARRGAVVRRLAAVETLGSTNVICSDKTGTLTRNEMTVVAIWLPDGRSFEVSGGGYAPEGNFTLEGAEVKANEDPGLRPLLESAALCNDAQLIPPDNEDSRWRTLGDPTEASLLTAALKGCLLPEDLRRDFPRRSEIPFDSTTKLMATAHSTAGKGERVCIKGAPEEVLRLCGEAQAAGNRVKLDEAMRAASTAAGEKFAGRALRLLGVAEAQGPMDPTVGFQQFQGRAVFLGLVGQ